MHSPLSPAVLCKHFSADLFGLGLRTSDFPGSGCSLFETNLASGLHRGERRNAPCPSSVPVKRSLYELFSLHKNLFSLLETAWQALSSPCKPRYNRAPVQVLSVVHAIHASAVFFKLMAPSLYHPSYRAHEMWSIVVLNSFNLAMACR